MVNPNNSDKIKLVLDRISTLAQEGRQKDALTDFIETLIDEKGFPNMMPEIKEMIKKDLFKRLDDFIAAKVIATLSDEDVVTFDQMVKEKKSEGEIQQFVATHIPNFVNFLTGVLLEFRGIYLGLVESGSLAPSQTASDLPPAPPAPTDNKMN